MKTLTLESQSYEKPVFTNGYLLAIFFFGALFIIGSIFGLYGFIVGHEKVYGVTRHIPWGILIGTYVFFVVTSTGLCLVSSIGHVFGYEKFAPIAKRSIFLSIITLLSGFFVIFFELEKPWRMAIYNIITPNFSSNIWWMGTLYGVYLFFMIIEFIFLQMNKFSKASIAGLLGVIAGVAAHSNLGAVFGLLVGREFWHGPYIPIYFVLSAMLSGSAAIIFFTWIAYKANGWQMSLKMQESLYSVGKLALLLIAILFFFYVWHVLSGITGTPPGEYEAWLALLTGKYALNFWGGEVSFGMILPFLIILSVKAKNLNAMFLASILCLIGIYFMRYDIVIVGQIVNLYHGFNVVNEPNFFNYTPSLSEVMIMLGGFGFCGSAFLLGEKIFNGHFSENH